MRKATRISIFAFAFLLPFAVRGAILGNTALVSDVHNGFQMLMENDFSGAETYFRTLGNRENDPAAGLFFAATARYYNMLDREDFSTKLQFFALLDSVETAAESTYQKSAPASFWYLQGSCIIYRALTELHNGKSIISLAGRFNDGLSALECATAAKHIKYDAYLSLGTAKYFKSAKIGFLRTIIGDERTKGLRFVKLAADSALYSRDLALHSLVFIYLDMDSLHKADSLVQILTGRYPDGRLPVWDLLSVAISQKDWQRTAVTAKRLRGLLPTNGNGYNTVECYYWEAEALRQMGKWSDALKAAQAGLAVPLDDNVSSRQDKLGKLKEIADNAQKRLSE